MLVQVKTNLFIEPSNNKAFPVHEAPYIDTEYLWNQYNFWVALPGAIQQEAMGQTSAFDLADSSRWKRLLDHPAYQVDFGNADVCIAVIQVGCCLPSLIDFSTALSALLSLAYYLV